MMARKIVILLAIFTVSSNTQEAEGIRITDSCSALDYIYIYTGKILTVEHLMTKVKKATEDSYSTIAHLQMQNKRLNHTLEQMLTKKLNKTLDQLLDEKLNQPFEQMLNERIGDILEQMLTKKSNQTVVQLLNEKLKQILDQLVNEKLNQTVEHLLDEKLNQILEQKLNEKLNTTLESIFIELVSLKNISGELNRSIKEQNDEILLLNTTQTELRSLEQEQTELRNLNGELNRILTTINEELNKTTKSSQTTMETIKDNVTMLEQKVLTLHKTVLNWTQETSSKYEAHLTSFNWTNAASVFAVKLSSSRHPITISANITEIIFDDIIVNVNNAYNTSNGKVRASTAGRYFFSLTVRAYGEGMGTGSAHASLMRNDQTVAYAVSTSPDIAYWAGTGSVSVVFDLDVGDIVYVGHPSRDEVFQGRTTIFTGCLLYPL